VFAKREKSVLVWVAQYDTITDFLEGINILIFDWNIVCLCIALDRKIGLFTIFDRIVYN